MSVNLQSLVLNVYLATTKESYLKNGKYFEANAKFIHAQMQTLNNDYISRVDNCDFVFVV